MSGRVALVTGANRGIGTAIAQLLVEQGYEVLAGARDIAAGEAAAAAIGARAVQLDVTDHGVRRRRAGWPGPPRRARQQRRRSAMTPGQSAVHADLAAVNDRAGDEPVRRLALRAGTPLPLMRAARPRPDRQRLDGYGPITAVGGGSAGLPPSPRRR